MKSVLLKPLILATTEQQLRIREIRNEDNVRKWMYNDHEIKLNEHLEWINHLKSDKKQIVFIVLEENDPIGVVSLNSIDYRHKKADWAYYLSSDSRGGLGSAIEYYFIDFIFNKIGLEKLNCEVLEGNDTVVKLHKKFLFKEEGFRESNIIKEKERIGVYYLGLQKKEWNNKHKDVYNKYENVLNKFSVKIDYVEDYLKSKHPLDEIEAARAKNNLNWMSILRLVLELSPEHGRNLVKDIRDLDKEISKLTDKLIDLK